MIYFDNAATTYPKPMAVIRAAERALLDYGANPGRSGHRLSAKTSAMVYKAREKCASFFGGEAENTVFTLNCTHALNFAIKGAVEMTGRCHIITTDLEHNSVIRPIHSLYKKGKITYSIADSGSSDSELTAAIEKLIRRDTKIIVMTAGCNVDGRITPLDSIAALCRRRNICLIADCAQAAGVIPISLKDGINIICAPGHKGLYGPMGTGVLVTDGNFPLTSLIEGGTGSNSLDIAQPQFLPDMLEGGTINTPGAIALGKGVDFVNSKGINKLHDYEMMLCDIFTDRLKNNENVRIYRKDNLSYLPVVAFNIKGIGASEFAEKLSEAGFYLRGGFHCNFLAHKKQGTQDSGCVRFAPSVFNTRADVVKLYDFINRL